MHLDINCSSLSSLQVSWVEAESTCVSYGGHLASINSDDDSIFLGSSVAAGNDVWIGAFSRKIDEWVWSDDTEWGYEQWKVRIEKKLQYVVNTRTPWSQCPCPCRKVRVGIICVFCYFEPFPNNQSGPIRKILENIFLDRRTQARRFCHF